MLTTTVIIIAILGLLTVWAETGSESERRFIYTALAFAVLFVSAWNALRPGGGQQAAHAQLSAEVDRPLPLGAVLQFELRHGIEPGRCAQYIPVLTQAAEQEGVPPEALLAIAWRESSCRHRQADGTVTRSWAGAVCLLQVMPRETGAVFADRPSAQDLEDIETCALWGARIFAEHYHRAHDIYDATLRYHGASASYAQNVKRDTEELRGIISQMAEPRMTWPIDAPASSMFKPFGVPVDYQAGGKHTGIDMSGGPGTHILAAAAGQVVHVGPLYCNQPGQCRGEHAIIIDHGNNVYTLYSHNSAAFVQVGERVRAGQPIAVEGNEGYSFGSHLHFEVHVGGPFTGNWRQPFIQGAFVDPLKYIY